MDLYAYCQIDDLGKIAKENGIEIPRLRGYRLMSEEEKVSDGEVLSVIRDQDSEIYRYMCTSVPRFHPLSNCSEFSPATDRLKRKYLIQENVVAQRFDGSEYSYMKTVGFRWDLIHGKARKRLKYALKCRRKWVLENIRVFNKYAGRPDVLYIHARIGGCNWEDYGGSELERQPWFLEKVDDYFDSTYCDIYAKIK